MSDLVLHGERAVESVVHDVHSGERELGADLVRDAGVDRHLEKRALLVAAGRPGDGRKLRDGVERGGLHAGAGAADVDHAAERQGGVVDEVVLQRSAHGHGAFDEREVGLLHRLRRELRAECLEGNGRARDEDESGGVGVDAVQRAGHERLVADVAHLGPAGDDAVHQRARLAVGKRLHGLCGGLVEGEQRRVLKYAPHMY